MKLLEWTSRNPKLGLEPGRRTGYQRPSRLSVRPSMLDSLIALADPGPAHAVAILAAFLAGAVRGFSGFGTAMVYVPLTAAAISPVFAVVSMQVMDTAPILPLLRKMIRIANWRLLAPLILSAFVSIPLGVYILKTVDPTPLRWAVAAIILTLLVVLWSGWRMTRPPRRSEMVGIGGLAGILGGIAGMAGPPIIIFYLAGRSNAAEVRASLYTFLAAMTGYMLIAFIIAGLMTANIVLWGIVMMLPYSAGLWCGSRLFSRADEAAFRRAAFAIIAAAVIVSLPLFDDVFR